MASLMAVGLLLLTACSSGEVADSDSRVIQLTFDGEQCIYEGPSVLSEGEVEVVFNNESSEETVFWFGRLDEGRTTQDVIDYVADDPSADPPSWTVPVYEAGLAPGRPLPLRAEAPVAPGLHNLVCGSDSPPHVYFGGELTVTP